MKELALNILDITENSVRAEGRHILVSLKDEGSMRTLRITDDGCGMSPELLERVTDPFATTRTTRPVGLGLPFLKLAAEQAGGTLEIESRQGENSGTTVTAVFDIHNIDCVPLGDFAATAVTLVQGNPEIDFVFDLDLSGMAEPFRLDTAEVREIMGPDVPLSEPEVLIWMQENFKEALENAECV